MLGIDKEVARIAQEQPTAERIQALKRIIPCRTIKSILKKTRQTRSCKRLPKIVMIWFVVAMGLCAPDCYRQIFRWLHRFRINFVPPQVWEKQIARVVLRLHRFRINFVPPRSSLCEARQRLGVAPLFWLVQGVVRLLAVPATQGAFYCSMRLMGIDSFVVDLFDSKDDARIFGRPRGSRGDGAFPQARVLALCEIGTHVMGKCLIKPIRCAETIMAKSLLRLMDPTMLLLWDRGFLSYDNLRDVLARKANLLARIKKSAVFSKIEVFADGSFLAKVYRLSHDRAKDRDGILVRIIEYTIDDPTRAKSEEVHRLLTTLLDAGEHPATTLVELYHERWEEELAIDELKTHQQARPVLRSQTPVGVVQEIYGLLLAHFVVRTLMFEAAATKKVAPRRVSFTGALKILRCRLGECPRHAAGQKLWYENLIAEIAEEILPPRQDRINPRVIKRKMSKWDKKRPHHYHRPQPIKPFRDAVNVKC